jgi:hypothetical protein
MRRLRRLGPCALLLAVAGCVPGSSPAFDNDPLFNGPRIPRNGTAAAPRPAVPANGTVQLPPPDGATSPAALAAAVPAADASSLRIGATPAALASAPHDAGDSWQPAPASATLQQPQPLVGPPPRPVEDADPPPPTVPVSAPTQPAVPTVGASTGTDQYEQLEEELTRRGVLFQSLEGPDDHGVWSFTCGVPKHGDPSTVHCVEASAVGERGLAALRVAIDRIDRDGP